MSRSALNVIGFSVCCAVLAGCEMQAPSAEEVEAKPATLYVQDLDPAMDKYDAPAAAEAQPDALAPGAETAAPADTAQGGTSEIEKLLKDRDAEYAQVAREARTKGIAGGAIRGGIIGMLIDADPATVIGGAVVGGLIGAASADQVASQIVTEHRNYLVRRWSLEKVIEAAKTDTNNTRFDLLLSDRYLAARDSLAFAAQAESVATLAKFKEQAVDRAVALRELLPVYATTEEARLLLEAELQAQTAMVKKLETNIERAGR